MPEYILPGQQLPAYAALDDFTKGYVQAAFFTSCGPDDEELEGKGFEDLAPETLARMIADCAAFQTEARTKIDLALTIQDDYTEERAGMDFWYSRNGHGCGFWDRDLEESGDQLHKMATKRGGCDFCLGDDGLIYL